MWSCLICTTFFLGCSLLANSQLFDDTVIEGTKGKDVVDASLRKLRRSNIFPGDKGFLHRLAFVQTAFGEDSDTYIPSTHGGIWKVGRTSFELTKSNPSLESYYEQIEDTFGIKWNELEWRDLRKPFVSMLAARLFMMTLSQIPGTIALQAQYWKDNYDPVENIAKFIDASTILESVPECRGMNDVVMVMDGSGSIGLDDFEKAKQLAIKLVETFVLDPITGSRLGFLVFDSIVRDHFDLENTLTIPEMTEHLRGIQYFAGGTSTGDGIVRGLRYFQEAPERDYVPTIMITFTDGESNSGIVTVPVASGMIAEAGIISIAVGIGPNIYVDELQTIAYNIADNVILTDDYDALVELFYDLNRQFCSVPQTPQLGVDVTGVIRGHERRYLRFPLPFEGLTLSISTNMEFIGWYSYSEPNPNSAIYDGIIDRNKIFIHGRSDEANVSITIGTIADSVGEMEYSIYTEEGQREITTESSTSTSSSTEFDTSTSSSTEFDTSTSSSTEFDTSSPDPTTVSTTPAPSTTSSTNPSPPTQTTMTRPNRMTTITTPTTTTVEPNPVVTVPDYSPKNTVSLIVMVCCLAVIYI